MFNTNLEKSKAKTLIRAVIPVSNGEGIYNFGKNVIVISANTIGGTSSLPIASYIRSNGFNIWTFCTDNNASGEMIIDIAYIELQYQAK